MHQDAGYAKFSSSSALSHSRSDILSQGLALLYSVGARSVQQQMLSKRSFLTRFFFLHLNQAALLPLFEVDWNATNAHHWINERWMKQVDL